jgi:hypothetical protein
MSIANDHGGIPKSSHENFDEKSLSNPVSCFFNFDAGSLEEGIASLDTLHSTLIEAFDAEIESRKGMKEGSSDHRRSLSITQEVDLRITRIESIRESMKTERQRRLKATDTRVVALCMRLVTKSYPYMTCHV